MLFRLILLFTLLPFLDLVILLKLGGHIGLEHTLIIIVVTGFMGAYLAKREGRHIIANIKSDIIQGRLPADELIGGLCVLAGGVFLLAPGLVTDILGLFLVLPATRILFINAIKNKFRRMLTEGNVWFYFRKD